MLPLEALLHDIHMEEPEKTTPESVPERRIALRLKFEGCIIESQFLEGFPQLWIIVRFGWIQAREDHRLHLLVPGKRFKILRGSNGISRPHTSHILLPRDDVPDLPLRKLAV